MQERIDRIRRQRELEEQQRVEADKKHEAEIEA